MLATMDAGASETLVSVDTQPWPTCAWATQMAAVARRHPGRWYAYPVCNPRY